MNSPTNKNLNGKIEAVDKKVDRRFNSMNSNIRAFKKTIYEKLDPIHDYVVGQKAIDKEKTNSGSKLMKNLVYIILVLSTIIAAFLGIDAGGALGG